MTAQISTQTSTQPIDQPSKFDASVNRKGSGCAKWDDVDVVFNAPDVLPMWVADMDLLSPPAVLEAIAARAAHGVFGYPSPRSYYYDALIRWLEKRHSWKVKPEWLLSTPGVVTALSVAVQTFSRPGDKIIIQPPVYPPFFSSIVRNGRQVAENPLIYENGRYTMDFDHLARLAKDARMLILCSPHNPVGRVWRKDELTTLAEICLENDVLIITDEIHSDLVFAGARHTPLASLSDTFRDNAVTFIAPSKTFNTAGLYTSAAVIANPERRSQFAASVQTLGIAKSNVFGIVAQEAAYRHGEPWLEQLLVYLQGNRERLTQFINQEFPGIRVSKPEGTYLAWLDCRELGLSQAQLNDFFIREAKVGLNDGASFGAQGKGFMRLNFGCPRANLDEGLERLAQALHRRRAGN